MERVFDPSRGKYLKATPEERVRQWFVKFLISKGYPITNIKTEQTFNLGAKQLRADIVVYKGQRPIMLVECKAPEVRLSQKTLEQIWQYNFVLGAKFLVLTNGKNILLCMVEDKNCKFFSEFLTWEQVQQLLN